MEYQDYYKTLGVDRNASDKEIRKAYRRLARQYHPDVNPGDASSEEKFKEINEAYQVLSDADKRAKYDQIGQSYQQWQQRGGQPGGFNWSEWMGGQPGGSGFRVEYADMDGSDPFSDFFRNIFGGTSGGSTRTAYQRQQVKGQDLEVTAQVTLEEAYHGTQRTVQIGDRRLEMKIPAGARDGMRIRLRGQGEPGYAGGQPGDLYVVVDVLPHALYRRDGADLHLDLKVPLYTAVLGGKATVPTLSGEVALTIQPGTQSGQTIRLRGKGLPQVRQKNVYGDLYVHVLVQVPTALTERERALFDELRTLRPLA